MTTYRTERFRAIVFLFPLFIVAHTLSAQQLLPAPKIDYVEPAPTQLHESDPAVIWFDDFDHPVSQNGYGEKSGAPTSDMPMGLEGRSLPMLYAQGQRGTGGRKVFFGDSPVYPAQTHRKGETFTEIFWRLYVKHQLGWQGGGPDKLSRATSLAPTGKWAQVMIAHVWSSGESLTLDPASGIRQDRLVTTRYNDFPNLRWLGNKPTSTFKIHADEEAGRWVCVEARAKLNTPGLQDGENQLWIDGRLQAERLQLDWRGRYTEAGINAVFLEAYWNDGSPVTQSRWIDHFVVSTRPVGPIMATNPPVIVRAPTHADPKMDAWQIELASDAEGQDVIWRSPAVPIGDGRLTVGPALTPKTNVDDAHTPPALSPGEIYFLRARQRSASSNRWSPWSPWHQPFVAGEPAPRS